MTDGKKLISLKLEGQLLRLLDLVARVEKETRTSLIEKSILAYVSDSDRLTRLYSALQLAEEVFEKSAPSEEELRKAARLYPLPGADRSVYEEIVLGVKVLHRLLEKGYPYDFAEYVSSLRRDEIHELRELVGALRLRLLLREAAEREAEKL